MTDRAPSALLAMRSHICVKGGRGFYPRQAIHESLLRQGLINFARVGTAVHCLLRPFSHYAPFHGSGNISVCLLNLGFQT